MSINKFNEKGYLDLTAYEALTNIEQEEKKESYRPLVFICSPFAGDTDRNSRKAQGYCRYAVSRNCIPIAPHLLFPQFMDDEDAGERKLALFMGTVLLFKCREVWVFGDAISNGMAIEIDKANQRGIVIRYFNNRCEEGKQNENCISR